MPTESVRYLTWRYITALVAIAASIVASGVLVEAILVSRTQDARQVNVAGRQRMLSQRIAKNALLLRMGQQEASATLDADLAEWLSVHRGLLDGAPERDLKAIDAPAIRAALDSLTGPTERVRAGVSGLRLAVDEGDGGRADRALDAILSAEQTFLPRMDRLVFALDAEATRAVWRLRGTIFVLFGGILAILVAVAVFVFRPAVAGVARSIQRADAQRRLLRAVIDAIPDYIDVKDTEGRATLRNRASAAALGLEDPDDAVGQTDAESSRASGRPDLGEASLAEDLAVVRTGEPVENREERSAEGGWLLTTKVPLRAPDGAIIGVVGVSRDVTEARAAQAKFRALVEHSVVGTAIIQDGRIVYANPRTEGIFGYDPGEMGGMDVMNLILEEDRPLVRENMRRRIEGEVDVVSYEARGVRKTGEMIRLELAGVAGEHGGRPAIIGTLSDVTERHEMEQILFHKAHHDDLTGLPNRLLFATRLEGALAEVDRDGGFAVLFADLDRFKVVNDTLGHSAGDHVLQAVACRLRQSVRPQDTVARLGGDEFAILLAGLPRPELAESTAARIREALLAPIRVAGRDLSVGSSIGIVRGRADHRTPDAVLREADLAMYEAKAAGRGRAATYSPDAHGPASQRFRLEMDLPGALARDEFWLAYQPIVGLADGALIGFEALVRWNHPELGLLYPGAFIAAAEESGQGIDLDRWVLRQACRQMGAWSQEIGPDAVLLLNVNCTGRDLLDGQYQDAIRQIPGETGFDADRLLLEITETLLVEDAQGVTAELRALQERGVRFCIDDFGTGYSSLSVLHTLPVDKIKVDRSFVNDMDVRSESRELVRTVIRLGQILDKAVVAEGIERPDQLRALREMGCAYGQGYFFAKPLAPDDARALIRSERLPWQDHWDTTPEYAATA